MIVCRFSKSDQTLENTGRRRPRKRRFAFHPYDSE